MEYDKNIPSDSVLHMDNEKTSLVTSISVLDMDNKKNIPSVLVLDMDNKKTSLVFQS